MHPVVLGLVEPKVPRCCHVVADREVNSPKGEGLTLFQHRTNMYDVVNSPKTDGF